MRTRQQFAHFFFQENFCPPTRQWSGKSSLSSKKCSLTSQKELRKWWMPNMEKSGSETPNVFMQQSMATSTISIWSLYAQCSHFTDCWVKIKTTSAGYWMPASYICQVGQKIRCHTLFEKKKKRSDYFAVTFGLLQVICVKWGMSNHILHTFSLKSSCVHRGAARGGCQSISTCSRLGYAFKAPCLSSWQHLKLLAHAWWSRMSPQQWPDTWQQNVTRGTLSESQIIGVKQKIFNSFEYQNYTLLFIPRAFKRLTVGILTFVTSFAFMDYGRWAYGLKCRLVGLLVKACSPFLSGLGDALFTAEKACIFLTSLTNSVFTAEIPKRIWRQHILPHRQQ